MAQSYPDDFEVQAYYALTLQASAPKSDLSYANQLKSAAILEKLFEQNPQHPGVTHYLIHAYDFAPLAEKGVASARRYAGIAPAVPHDLPQRQCRPGPGRAGGTQYPAQPRRLTRVLERK